MESKEITKELAFSYDELVAYLLDKYGPCEYDYFLKPNCKSRNKKVGRSNEGLVCHHIDEDKAIMLNNPIYAKNNPFDYQRASRIVYCNILEHLILHVKIVEEPRHPLANLLELPGVGGVVKYLCPQINDYYNGYNFKRQHEKNIMKIIANNFDDYIGVLKYLLKVTKGKAIYADKVTPERLSEGFDHQIVEKVYKEL